MEIHKFIKAVHEAEGLIADAQDDQWQLPPNPIQNVGGGKGNSVSNPTFNIATDERRLALREAVTETQRLLWLASKALENQTAVLERAIDRWQGNL